MLKIKINMKFKLKLSRDICMVNRPIHYIQLLQVDVFGTVIILCQLHAEIAETVLWNFQVGCMRVFNWRLFEV
jgi:hypothetical protein